MSFNILPTELLEHIFSYCDRQDQLVVALVCHRWSNAVEPLLLRRTCLKVSYISRQYNRTLMPEKAVLEKSTRRYSCVRVEWDASESAQNMSSLHDLLDICQERFSIQRLFIRGISDKTLAHFFEDRRIWLKELLELHVEIGSPNKRSWAAGAFHELSLPKLQKLTWLEIKPTNDTESWYYIESNICFGQWYAFVVIAPELSQLKVRLNSKLVRNPMYRRSTLKGVCELFLPSLELKTFSKLQNVEIEGLVEVNRRQMRASVMFLKNLKVLSLVMCHSNVIKKICHKCCNLRELTIDEPIEGLLSFQVSQTLSPVLEKFTFRAIYHSFARNDRAVFSTLRYLKLEDMSIGLILGNVPLVAPLLNTFIARQSDYCQLILPHKEQITTMVMELDSLSKELAIPPPNVTELFLRLSNKSSEYFSVKDYLKLFPNLRRLTLAGIDESVIDGALLLSAFPYLEYFHAHRLKMHLSDFRDMTSLKSIILTECSILIQPGDKSEPVTVANYFRAELVTIEVVAGEGYDGISVERFPIRTNERQPPVEAVDSSNDDQQSNVFSSRNFHMRLPADFSHIVEPKVEYIILE